MWQFHSQLFSFEKSKKVFPSSFQFQPVFFTQCFCSENILFIQYSLWSLRVAVVEMTIRRTKISNRAWIPSEMPHNNHKRQTRIHSQYGWNVVVTAAGAQCFWMIIIIFGDGKHRYCDATCAAGGTIFSIVLNFVCYSCSGRWMSNTECGRANNQKWNMHWMGT